MGHDNLHVTPIRCHLIQVHRIAVGQFQSTTTTHARANAAVPCVKNSGQSVFIDHFVNGPGHLVVGMVALHRGVELEPSHTLFFDETFGFSRTHLAFVRVDAGKSDHHVAVVTRCFSYFFIGNASTPHVGFGIHREHDQADLAFTVIRHGFLDGRPSV